jgi:DNA mismatch repair protein MutL
VAIIRLSENTINLIAAGEVVERPSSVVKELVENSIDAKARNIEIYLEQAGKNLIIIRDDGAGMLPDEMLLAIERHTTSKLDESDILNIRSYGFRGEALASIASVSKLSITSKTVLDNLATELKLVNGQATLAQVIADVGTKIEVKDLFYSIPARLKFLKSNTTELANCIEVVKKLALSSPQISFTLKCEEKILLKLGTGLRSSLAAPRRRKNRTRKFRHSGKKHYSF